MVAISCGLLEWESRRPGAQTERRGVPARNLPDGENSPADTVNCRLSVSGSVEMGRWTLGQWGLDCPQQFFRMYDPSMLAVLPFKPVLSVLLMVLATVNESMYTVAPEAM